MLLRIERRDDSENNASGEDRWQPLGMAGKILFFVYTERGDVTRLISKARKQSGKGERVYRHPSNFFIPTPLEFA
jgi:uncharacterized DUF497 family protein